MIQLKILLMTFLMSSLLSCNSEVDVDLYAKDAASSGVNDVQVVTDVAPLVSNGTPSNGSENAESIITLDYTDTDKASSCSVTNLSNISITSACSCDGAGVCTVGVTGSLNYAGAVSFDYTVSVNNVISNTASINYTIDATILICPTGFVVVDGNGVLGTADFCVMKYEAKCAVPPCNNTTDIPVSQATGTPWVSIRADESEAVGSGAQARCEAMSEGGFSGTFSLISNPEWMTIARDIENTASNWSSNIIGTGHIPRGHSDNSPGNALAVTDTNDPYSDTGNNSGEVAGSGWEQKRTHTLSNGSEVWDFAGNVWERTDWDATAAGFTLGPNDESNGWKEFSTAQTGSLLDDDFLPDGAYTSANSFGQWHGGPWGAALRGGAWSIGSDGGVFALRLSYAPSLFSTLFGFRCSYRPQQAPTAKPITSANANENTEVLVTLNYADVNGDQATSCSVSSLTNVTETTSCSCSAGVCTVGVTGITNYSGPASFNYTVTDDDGTSNIASASFSISANILCPTGFVEVNGNGILGTADFCVMKYEAKCDAAGACDDIDTTSLPVSQATTTPWVNIRADESAGGGTPGSGAQARCEAMSEGGFTGTFSLISNPEWMTIARDIENTASNWSSNTIGTGHIPRGHTDSSPFAALAVTDTNDPYSDTLDSSGDTPGSGWEQKRTHILSNGSELWDIGGNVWEWIDWDSSVADFTLGPTDEATSYKEFSTAQTGSLVDDDFLPDGAYTSANSFGQWYGGAGGAAVRSGAWLNGSVDGVYALYLFYGPTSSLPYVGFRCSYRP
jgi:hypothetical protein